MKRSSPITWASTIGAPTGAAPTRVASTGAAAKDKKARAPDFTANEFICIWHVMVSEEGRMMPWTVFSQG